MSYLESRTFGGHLLLKDARSGPCYFSPQRCLGGSWGAAERAEGTVGEVAGPGCDGGEGEGTVRRVIKRVHNNEIMIRMVMLALTRQ